VQNLRAGVDEANVWLQYRSLTLASNACREFRNSSSTGNPALAAQEFSNVSATANEELLS
jgi:hypothetical protein